MTAFLNYRLILSIIVYVMLTAIFTVGVVYFVRTTIKLIKAGLDDEKIKAEYKKEQARKTSAVVRIVDKFVLIFSCAVLFILFAFSLIVTVNDGKPVGAVPSLSVVQSDSMSKIHKDHKYLKQGEVTDQIQVFDLILVNQLPPEDELKENDVVLYVTDGVIVVHRIVVIEEPNPKHPDERYFLLQGDANDLSDRFPVTYKQMRGIYRGQRIPFIGSFVNFMQSPAGYLCIILILFAIIATPIAEKRIRKYKMERLIAMGLIDGDGKLNEEDEELDPLKNFGYVVPKRQEITSPYYRAVMVKPIVLTTVPVVEKVVEKKVYVPVAVPVNVLPTKEQSKTEQNTSENKAGEKK